MQRGCGRSRRPETGKSRPRRSLMDVKFFWLSDAVPRQGRRKFTGSPSSPLPPPPLKAATGAGFAKLPCKILIPKGLGVKILKRRHLGRLAPDSATAMPETILPHLRIVAQGQMSHNLRSWLWISRTPSNLFLRSLMGEPLWHTGTYAPAHAWRLRTQRFF
jgi:hypothetical protein